MWFWGVWAFREKGLKRMFGFELGGDWVLKRGNLVDLGKRKIGFDWVCFA